MRLRMIVLKKSSIRRNLALSIMMIFIGITLINPFVAKANPTDYVTKSYHKLYYLYPMPQNNNMFWLESNPSLGYGTLQEWNRKLSKGEMIVAVPSNMQLASLGGLDRIGKYVQNKIKGRADNGKYPYHIFHYLLCLLFYFAHIFQFYLIHLNLLIAYLMELLQSFLLCLVFYSILAKFHILNLDLILTKTFHYFVALDKGNIILNMS